jgi:hypothetical protein
VYFPEKRIFTTGLFRGFFEPVSPIIPIISQNLELTGFPQRKTGLFKPVWTKDHLSGYLTSVEMGKKRRFYD